MLLSLLRAVRLPLLLLTPLLTPLAPVLHRVVRLMVTLSGFQLQVQTAQHHHPRSHHHLSRRHRCPHRTGPGKTQTHGRRCLPRRPTLGRADSLTDSTASGLTASLPRRVCSDSLVHSANGQDGAAEEAKGSALPVGTAKIRSETAVTAGAR